MTADVKPDMEKELEAVESAIAQMTQADAAGRTAAANPELETLRKRKAALERELFGSLTPWQIVQIARHPKRPILQDYIDNIFSEFIELRGDRCFGDDRGLVGGLAVIGDRRVALIGHRKGRTIEENVESNFGMAKPDGYRKALRIMKLAEKYRLPILAFIDTQGAYPGVDAEARGQAEAIARNLMEMSLIEVPIIVLVTGEGGSGGALGIGVGDTVMMLAHSVYSVISPEGCASILWRDEARAPEAAAALKVTADSLHELGIVDEIIPEPTGGAHRDPAATMAAVREALLRRLKKYARYSRRKLVDARYDKYTRTEQIKHRFAKS
jgi:acetyl-CoA carboxylase carboxyl transferase subunit alpha